MSGLDGFSAMQAAASAISPNVVRLTYLQNQLRVISNASTKSKVTQIEKTLTDNRIVCFRGNVEDHVEVLPAALICEAAGQVRGIFASWMDIQTDINAVTAAKNLCVSMMKFYDNEELRVDAFLRALENFIPITKSESKATGEYGFRAKKGPDAFIELQNENLPKPSIVCLVEAKWEVGTSGDPSMQICLDYSSTAGSMSFNRIEGFFPCLLLTISGTMMTAQLGVVGQHAQIEWLGSHSFVGLGRNDIECGGKFLSAVRFSLEVVKAYYTQPIAAVNQVDVPFVSTTTICGYTVHIEYVRTLKKGSAFVYEAEVVGGQFRRLVPPKVVLKFVTGQYGKDVHSFLSESHAGRRHRLCPRLHYTELLPSGWTVVVMDKVDAPLLAMEVINLTTREKCGIMEDLTTAVKIMHDYGYVHGDLREPNILITRDQELGVRAYIIDFDFAGKEGQARYPYDLNVCSFRWLEDEDIGQLIKKTHDLSALDEYANRFLGL